MEFPLDTKLSIELLRIELFAFFIFFQSLIKCSLYNKSTLEEDREGPELDSFGPIFNFWVKNIILFQSYYKSQYFPSQIFCDSLLSKANLP